MKKLFTLLLLIGTLCISNTLLAQTKTPYEKKVDNLHIEYFRALQIDETLIFLGQKYNDWSIVTNSKEFSFAVHSLNKLVFLELTTAFAEELKNAEKLKTK